MVFWTNGACKLCVTKLGGGFKYWSWIISPIYPGNWNDLIWRLRIFFRWVGEKPPTSKPCTLHRWRTSQWRLEAPEVMVWWSVECLGVGDRDTKNWGIHVVHVKFLCFFCVFFLKGLREKKSQTSYLLACYGVMKSYKTLFLLLPLVFVSFFQHCRTFFRKTDVEEKRGHRSKTTGRSIVGSYSFQWFQM